MRISSSQGRCPALIGIALLASVSPVLGACSGDSPAPPDAGGNWASDPDRVDGGSAGNGGDNGSQVGDGDGDGAACAHADVKVTREPPTVWLVVDRTLSHVGEDNVTMYTAMWRDMMGPTGTVTELQSQIRFGLMLTGVNSSVKPFCPNLSAVEPAFDNHATILDSYPEYTQPGTMSLTYYGLEAVLKRAKSAPDPKALHSHAVVVFMPQGVEHLCFDEALQYGGAPVEQNDRLVSELAELGVRTFVLGSDIDCTGAGCWVTPFERLERMAMLGKSGHGPFLVGKPGEVTRALREITSNLVDCQVTLQGAVKDGSECTGDVQIDGVAVPCNDANGWKLNGPSSIEFVGEACTQLKQKPEAQIKARFPCDVIVLY